MYIHFPKNDFGFGKNHHIDKDNPDTGQDIYEKPIKNVLKSVNLQKDLAPIIWLSTHAAG